jgi:Predicted phosphoesterases, related to the Icc protein
MRAVILSDTHDQLSLIKVPEADLLIHCGDATGEGTVEQITRFIEELAALPHPFKILIPGNHDRLFDEDPETARKLLDPSIHYLQDTAVVINGVKIYGTPWVHGIGEARFNAFTLPPRSLDISERRKAIPDDTDILVTHCPPAGILDSGYGCTSLRWRIEEIRPKLVAFGHVHSAYGTYTDPDSGVRYVNAASCTSAYEPTNPPIVIEL